jgi:hypothetical protein
MRYRNMWQRRTQQRSQPRLHPHHDLCSSTLNYQFLNLSLCVVGGSTFSSDAQDLFATAAVCIPVPALTFYLRSSSDLTTVTSGSLIRSEMLYLFSNVSNGYRGLFPWRWSGQGVKLTTHLQLLPMSRKCGSIHPLPHTPSWCSA